MPKRSDLKNILIIGQACEFEHSGVQACKALRAEGYKLILVNSNPATTMSDWADVAYIEPITWEVLARIIARERPDALLATLGGQSALDCALDLHQHGVLAQYKVALIGVSPDAIDKAQNRTRFRDAMTRIGLASARSSVAHSMAEAWQVQQTLGFPVAIRPSLTPAGGGIAHNAEQFHAMCTRSLEAVPASELLIEESLIGWKKYEIEALRDKEDHCILVCAIEHLDPTGVQGDDAIMLAPAQTLTDSQYQNMRHASLAVLREIGVEGGASNLQFAIDPADGRMIVTGMQPYVSRSSTLASKATGFPLAKVAAMLALGFTLDELGVAGGAAPVSACIVTRMPRCAFEPSFATDGRLNTRMQAVGEVMAVGRTFEESFQKALRALEIGIDGLRRGSSSGSAVIDEELGTPGSERIWYVGDAFAQGYSLERVHRLSGIDPWFLSRILTLVQTESWLATQSLDTLDQASWFKFKQQGFGDRRLACLLRVTEEAVRARRHAFGVRPVYQRVESALESQAGYLYSTYDEGCGSGYVPKHAPKHEFDTSGKKKIVILGGGPNRIGQGTEFDYCCVQAALALRTDGHEVIMVNCNPQAVSSDCASSDRLYFEALTLEDVLEIVYFEQPSGVIVQTPLRMALANAGIPILGTAPDMIDASQDRARLQPLLHQLGLRQPPQRSAHTPDEARRMAQEIGYPLLLRRSQVAGGSALDIAEDALDLERCLRTALNFVPDAPMLLERFLDDAIEVDVDCLSDSSATFICGVMEHIEQVGVHAGDSACSLPPYSLAPDTVKELKRQTALIAKGLNVVGLMNVQFAIQPTRVDGRMQDAIFVLEVNLYASRTVAFVSKAIGLPLAGLAARCMMGQALAAQGMRFDIAPDCFNVREAMFPFAKFPGVDTLLGPEMKSTGQVMGRGKTFGEAYYKSQLGAGIRLPRGGRVFMRVKRSDQARAVAIARQLHALGFEICASLVTSIIINAADIPAVTMEDAQVLDLLASNAIAMVILTVDEKRSAIMGSRAIRVAALKAGTAFYTTIAGADAAVEAVRHIDTYDIYSLQEQHPSLASADGAPLAGRLAPNDADLAAAAIVVPERRGRRRGIPAIGAHPVKVFIRQPFTESDQEQQRLIADILLLIDSANGTPYTFQYLTGIQAESAVTFKKSFERETSKPFTPQNFREHRLELLAQAEVFINIRVGMSESSAFEMGYHIFRGSNAPILFLVWKHAPIKTTLLRELEDLCDVTYLEFEQVDDLRRGIHQFFNTKILGRDAVILQQPGVFHADVPADPALTA